jgi:hypothetical protein
MDVAKDWAQSHTHLQDLLTSSSSSLVGPVSEGFGKRGRFSNPSKTKEGFGHVTPTSRQKHAHHKIR